MLTDCTAAAIHSGGCLKGYWGYYTGYWGYSTGCWGYYTGY